MLQELGIPVVYGMEWLKKNGFSEGENQKLAAAHPFLPYALLLSRQELERLSLHGDKVYTSFPVPILLREELSADSVDTDQGNVIRMPQVHFYVLFNENLLNEERLQILIQEKERQIQKIQENIQTREAEYREYFMFLRIC